MSNFGTAKGEFLHEGAKCEKTWGDRGLLNDIKDKTVRQNTAILMENQELSCNLNESSSTTAGDVANFKRISIPLVRRIFPQLIANKIVSVQPLLGPVGLVYYLRFRYATDKGATLGATNKSSFPTDDALSLQQLSSGLVNLDIFYSSQTVSLETVTNAGGTTTLTYTLKHTPILAGTESGTIYQGSTAIQTFTIDASGTFTISSTSNSPNVTAGSINLTTGAITLTWSSDPSTNSIVVTYDYNMECNTDQPEVNLTVEQETITAVTRKLRAVWSFEAQQDLRSQYSLDAEQELTTVLAQEINLEIDREIITNLRNNAGTNVTWDYNTALGDTVKEKYEALFVKVSQVSNIIHKKTLRSGANWIICSPEVASIFETATAGFAPAPSESFTSSLGVQYVGTVSNRWKLYKDPQFPTNNLLMGYKGDTYMDSGFFYCPYVPLMQTPLVLDPNSFCPRRGLMTRYGLKLLNNGARFYATIAINNFSI
jgi:hypothetical protein